MFILFAVVLLLLLLLLLFYAVHCTALTRPPLFPLEFTAKYNRPTIIRYCNCVCCDNAKASEYMAFFLNKLLGVHDILYYVVCYVGTPCKIILA